MYVDTWEFGSVDDIIDMIKCKSVVSIKLPIGNNYKHKLWIDERNLSGKLVGPAFKIKGRRRPFVGDAVILGTHGGMSDADFPELLGNNQDIGRQYITELVTWTTVAARVVKVVPDIREYETYGKLWAYTRKVLDVIEEPYGSDEGRGDE